MNTLLPKIETLSTIQRAIIYYSNKLAEKFSGRFLTHAMLEEMNRMVRNLQQFQAINESHPIWKLPVKVIVNPNNQNSWLVVEDK